MINNIITVDVEVNDESYGDIVLEISFIFNPADPLDFSSDWNYEGNIEIASVKAYDGKRELNDYKLSDHEALNFVKAAIREAELSKM